MLAPSTWCSPASPITCSTASVDHLGVLFNYACQGDDHLLEQALDVGVVVEEVCVADSMDAANRPAQIAGSEAQPRRPLTSVVPSSSSRASVSSLSPVTTRPCNAATKQQMCDWLGPIIHEMHAVTEGPGTWIQPQQWLDHPGSVGRADPTRLWIRHDTGEIAEPRQDGAVWSRATTPFHSR